MDAILIRDIDELRNRLLGTGEPSRLYSLVREVTQHPEMGYTLWRFLCRMVEPDRMPNADMRADLEALAARGAWRSQYSLDVHTWIAAASLGRLAIYLDWTVEQGALPAARRRQLAGEMLEAAEKHILPVLETRVSMGLQPGQRVWLPNQGAALIFACAAAGSVLGHRRGRSPRARSLAQKSIEYLANFMSHLWPDGYDCEGPTYQLGVQGSALALTSAILEQATGEELFDRQFAPDCPSLRRWFETTCFGLLSRNGLARPFDDYGYSRPSSLLPFTYAAARSGDSAFLEPVRRYCLWHAHQCLWDTDDRTLSLIFWPGQAGPAEIRNIGLLPSTLACLSTDGPSPTDVLTTWKPCERLPETHAHTDPGNLIVECAGVPLVLDGRPSMMKGAALRGSPYHRFLAGTNTDYFMPFRFGESDLRDQGVVSLAPHNTVVIDGLYDLPLDEPAGGRLLDWQETEDATRVLMDVAAPYRSAFDLETFEREVIVYRDGPCLVRDRLVSASAHEFVWRMHVRPEVHAREHGWDIVTQEGVRMSVRTLGQAALETDRIEGYPGSFEGYSTRLQMRAHGKSAEFAAAFVAEDLRQELTDVTDGWSFRADRRLEGFENGWAHGGFEPEGEVSLSLTPSLSGHPHCTGLHVWLARRLPVLDSEDGSPILLEMAPTLVPVRAWLDGQPLVLKQGSWEALLPLQVELGKPDDVSGKQLVLLMADVPAARPPAPLRLIRRSERTGPPLHLQRGQAGEPLLRWGEWERRIDDRGTPA